VQEKKKGEKGIVLLPWFGRRGGKKKKLNNLIVYLKQGGGAALFSGKEKKETSSANEEKEGERGIAEAVDERKGDTIAGTTCS